MRLSSLILSLGLALQFAPVYADAPELGITPENVGVSTFQNEKGEMISRADFEQAAAAGRQWSKRMILNHDGTPRSIEFVLVAKDEAGKPAKSPFKSIAHLETGDTFPEFELKTAAGKAYSHRDLNGKISLINFSFAGCAPCIKEVPTLNRFAAAHPDVLVLSMTFDDATASAGFVERTGFRWPQLVAAKALLDKIDVRSFPSFALIGADGKVIATDSASMNPNDPEALDKWMGKHVPPKT